jgi:hypothetical protein
MLSRRRNKQYLNNLSNASNNEPTVLRQCDLTDEEWQCIAPLLPPEKLLGKLREVNLREVLNAIFYRADNGIKWRNLPYSILRVDNLSVTSLYE